MYPSLIFSVSKTLCLFFRINTITTLRPRVWIYGWRKSNKVSLLLLTWLTKPLSVSFFRSISKSGLNIRISAYQCPGIRVMRFLWVHVNTVSPIVIITRIRIQSGNPQVHLNADAPVEFVFSSDWSLSQAASCWCAACIRLLRRRTVETNGDVSPLNCHVTIGRMQNKKKILRVVSNINAPFILKCNIQAVQCACPVEG